MPIAIRNRLRPVINAQPSVDIFQVSLHGRDGDDELGCNLGIRQAQSQQVENLRLPTS